MNNPFARPLTQGQWLLGSVCWALSCVGSWLLVVNQLDDWNVQGAGAETLEIGLFWLGHVLIWRRALAGGDYFLSSPISQISWLEVICCMWFAALVVFQLATLFVGGFFMLLLIVIS